MTRKKKDKNPSSSYISDEGLYDHTAYLKHVEKLQKNSKADKFEGKEPWIVDGRFDAGIYQELLPWIPDGLFDEAAYLESLKKVKEPWDGVLFGDSKEVAESIARQRNPIILKINEYDLKLISKLHALKKKPESLPSETESKDRHRRVLERQRDEVAKLTQRVLDGIDLEDKELRKYIDEELRKIDIGQVNTILENENDCGVTDQLKFTFSKQKRKTNFGACIRHHLVDYAREVKVGVAPTHQELFEYMAKSPLLESHGTRFDQEKEVFNHGDSKLVDREAFRQHYYRLNIKHIPLKQVDHLI